MRKLQEIPPPPQKPDPIECCGSGCVPCIYDYYFEQLGIWEEKNTITLDAYQRLKVEASNADCVENALNCK